MFILPMPNQKAGNLPSKNVSITSSTLFRLPSKRYIFTSAARKALAALGPKSPLMTTSAA
jgi:hypothetical protein